MLQHGPGVTVICIKNITMEITCDWTRTIRYVSYKQNDIAVTESLKECECGMVLLHFGEHMQPPPNHGFNELMCKCGRRHPHESRVLFPATCFSPIHPAEQITYTREEKNTKK